MHIHTNSVTDFISTGQHIAVALIDAPLKHAILEDQRFGWSAIEAVVSGSPRSSHSLQYLELTVYKPFVCLPFEAIQVLKLHVHEITTPTCLNAHLLALSRLPASLVSLHLHLNFDRYDDNDSSAQPAWSGTHLGNLTRVKACHITVSRPVDLFECLVPRMWGVHQDVSEISITSAKEFGMYEHEHIDELKLAGVDPDDSEFDDELHDAQLQCAKAGIFRERVSQLRSHFPTTNINVMFGTVHHHIPPPYPP